MIHVRFLEGAKLLTVGAAGDVRVWGLDGLVPLATLDVNKQVVSAAYANGRLALGCEPTSAPRFTSILLPNKEECHEASLGSYRAVVPQVRMRKRNVRCIGTRIAQRFG